MRIKTAAAKAGKALADLDKFSEYLLRIGEGREAHVIGDTENIYIEHIAKNMDELELIKKVYPDIINNATNNEFITERAILSPLKSDVDIINQITSKYFPGEVHTYLSADSLLYPEQRAKFSTEFLNGLKGTGLPEHKLDLKVHQPIILLRNVAQELGLCNGTRLIIQRFHKHLIEVSSATGKRKGNK